MHPNEHQHSTFFSQSTPKKYQEPIKPHHYTFGLLLLLQMFRNIMLKRSNKKSRLQENPIKKRNGQVQKIEEERRFLLKMAKEVIERRKIMLLFYVRRVSKALVVGGWPLFCSKMSIRKKRSSEKSVTWREKVAFFCCWQSFFLFIIFLCLVRVLLFLLCKSLKKCAYSFSKSEIVSLHSRAKFIQKWVTKARQKTPKKFEFLCIILREDFS